MALKLENAEEAYSERLDIFDTTPVDTSILQREWVEFRPVTQ